MVSPLAPVRWAPRCSSSPARPALRSELFIDASFTIFQFEARCFLSGDAPIGQLGKVARRKMLQDIRHCFFTRPRRDPKLARCIMPDLDEVHAIEISAAHAPDMPPSTNQQHYAIKRGF